jgi:16S rRNA C967 or C1407 C5-methylase (RsmB/RsmF family)
MASWKVYLRFDPEKLQHYVSQCEDEEYVAQRTKKNKVERIYGEKEALIKEWHHKRPKNTTIVYEVIDQTDAKFREKWEPFKKDRIEGWKKGGRILTKEMMELLGADGNVDLAKLTNIQKDKYYDLIARKVARLQQGS